MSKAMEWNKIICKLVDRWMAVYFQNSAKYRWVVLEENNATIMAV